MCWGVVASPDGDLAGLWMVLTTSGLGNGTVPATTFAPVTHRPPGMGLGPLALCHLSGTEAGVGRGPCQSVGSVAAVPGSGARAACRHGVHLLLSPSLHPQVMQVLNADAIVVKLNSGDHKTIHLSSIRPPRLEGDSTQVTVGTCGREVTLGWDGEGALLCSAPRWCGISAGQQSPASVTVPGWSPLPVGAPLLSGPTPLSQVPPFSSWGSPIGWDAGGLGEGLTVHSGGRRDTDAPLIPCLSFPFGIVGAIVVLCSGEVRDPHFQDVGLGDVLADV